MVQTGLTAGVYFLRHIDSKAHLKSAQSMSFTFLNTSISTFHSSPSKTLGFRQHVSWPALCSVFHPPFAFDPNGNTSLGIPALSKSLRQTACAFASGFLCGLNSSTVLMVFPLINSGFLPKVRCTSVRALFLSGTVVQGWLGKGHHHTSLHTQMHYHIITAPEHLFFVCLSTPNVGQVEQLSMAAEKAFGFPCSQPDWSCITRTRKSALV